MKKIIGLFLAALLCLSLVGCMRNTVAERTVAERADNLILEIGNVSLSSKQKILDAERAVDELEEDDYAKLKNLHILQQARSDYDTMVAEKIKREISILESSITKSGSVNLKMEPQIRTARKNYNRASEEIKSKITNLHILEAAEDELSRLKAQNVVELINKIGTVTLESDVAIRSAQTAFAQLSFQEKQYVENLDILTTAVSELANLKAEEAARIEREQEAIRKNAFSSMRTETDKVLGITWYYPKNFPSKSSARSFLLPYIGVQNNKCWLVLRCNFTSSNWLFFESIIVSVDGYNYNASFDYFDIMRDNAAYSVWEWIDYDPTKTDIEMLQKIANSKEAILRFNGENKHYDLTITQADKQAIKDIFIVYDSLKNSH